MCEVENVSVMANYIIGEIGSFLFCKSFKPLMGQQLIDDFAFIVCVVKCDSDFIYCHESLHSHREPE